MFNNEPYDYHCPFCLLSAGIENEWVTSRSADIVYEDDLLLAFICAEQWPYNKGHVLITPREHYENIYDLPDFLAADIHVLARHISIAMKMAYQCDGISTRQHNEKYGNQEVWHYHLHVFPRYRDDCLYEIPEGDIMPEEERAGYAALLGAFLNKNQLYQTKY